MLCLLSPLVVCVILESFFPKVLPNLFHNLISQRFPDLTVVDVVIPGLICILIAIFLFGNPPDLICPACAKYVERALCSYCPECGAHAVEPAHGIFSAQCTNCGKTMDPRPRATPTSRRRH